MASRRGNVAVKVALFSVVLLSMAALGVDLPYARVVRLELEQAAEAAAHAGAARLDRTDAGITAAYTTARAVGLANAAAGAPVDPDTIETGVWDGTTFTASSDAVTVNAVRVATSRPELSLFFSPAAFGRDTVAVGGRSVAYRERGGASEVTCYLPLALPSCLVDEWGMDALQDRVISLNPPGADNVGWGRIGASPNARWTRDQLGDCEASGSAEAGDTVGLQNGMAVNAIGAVADAIAASSTTWDANVFGTQPARMGGSSISASDYGKTLEGSVLVFESGPEYCEDSGGQFNGSHPLRGFVWVAIYDVRNTGRAEERTLKLRVDGTREHEVEGEAGGEDMGVIAVEPPRFVASF